MLPYFWYILKAIICSGILFGYYWLFLRNKIFHQYNRFYLLAALALSLLLPLVKIDFWQQNNPQQSQVIRALRVVSAGDDYMNNVIITANRNNWSMQQLYSITYWAISVIFLLVLLQTLFVIRSLLKKHPVQLIDKISFINTDDKSTPFSFLKYIFWNANIDIETPTGKQIFKHEVAHIQEKHSYDKLFINSILIFFWCNPFFWLYRKELNMIHEFIADKKAVENSDTSSFAAMILQAAYPQHRFQLANNFFYSPIKRRLLMLTKNNNPRANYIGRVMVLPLALLIFAAFTFKAKTTNHIYNGKKITVVIDAGHGGQDAGVKGADGILEKDLTLAIAKKIKELNTNDAIEIILTKESDIFLTKEKKIEFVKNLNPSLYISLHADKGTENESGMSVHIAKDGFPYSVQGRVLGSVILNEFMKNYDLPVSPQLVQHHLWTLEQNPCPSIYLETGLISNQTDLNYLQSENGKETIAKNILLAIEKFANSTTQNSTSLNNMPIADTTPIGIFINTKHAGPNYLKTDDYKNKALVIIDSKEIGNVGFHYIEKSNTQYSSIVIYNPAEARKIYGEKGKYGVLKLTKTEAIFIKADSIFFDDKTQAVKLKGSKTTVDGDLSKSIIYIDGKLSTPEELNNISPGKISSVNILKGEKIADVIESKGKTSVINVSLKPDDLQEVVVVGSPIKKIGDGGNTVISKDMDPRFYFGDVSGSRSEAGLFKRQKEIRISNGYEFVSAQVYFSGAGFPDVATIFLSGSSLNPIQHFLDKCIEGSVVTFDNIRVRDSEGKERTLDGISYSLYSAAEIKEVPQSVPQPKLDYASNPAKGTVVERPISKQETNQFQQDDKVFIKVEVSPEFTGGQTAWKDYLVKNLKASIPVDEGWGAGKYTVIVKFIVHTDGSVSDVTTENYKGTKTALESIRVIKDSPKWQPAIQNGHKVNAYKRQPITFLIEEN